MSGSVAFALALALLASPAERLHDLFDREWQARLNESPQLATSVGVHVANDRTGPHGRWSRVAFEMHISSRYVETGTETMLATCVYKFTRDVPFTIFPRTRCYRILGGFCRP